MELSAFYGIVSGINFTLLGLWWVAVRERTDIGAGDAAGRRMAYLVSLQFVIPGTMSLLAQVAPTGPGVWRTSFALAGLAGAVGTIMLADSLQRLTQAGVLPTVLRWLAAPLYALVAVVAALPDLPDALGFSLSPIEVEGFLLTLLVFLGVQAAWVVAMTPRREDPAAVDSA